jgi:hypothetical protein
MGKNKAAYDANMPSRTVVRIKTHVFNSAGGLYFAKHLRVMKNMSENAFYLVEDGGMKRLVTDQVSVTIDDISTLDDGLYTVHVTEWADDVPVGYMLKEYCPK